MEILSAATVNPAKSDYRLLDDNRHFQPLLVKKWPVGPVKKCFPTSISIGNFK